MMRSALIEEAEQLVTALYREQLPSWARYHTLEHTREVVAACVEIGGAMALTPDEKELIGLAAWFHDLGYCEGAEGHEERGAQRAEEFLKGHGYPRPSVQIVKDCILATRIPQRPMTDLERIVCDADLLYIGGTRFTEHSEALREEWQLRRGIHFGDGEWIQKNIEFVGGCDFHTDYVRRTYGMMRSRNLSQLFERLDRVRATP